MRVFKTTWTNRQGKKVPTKRYYIEFRDHLQITRRLTAFTERALSEALGRRIVKLVNYKMAGESLDPELVRWLEQIPASLKNKFVKIGLISKERALAGKFLSDHMQDFRQSLLAKGDTVDYVKTVTARTRRILEGCGFTYWTDVSASQVGQYLYELKNGSGGVSAQTFNFYLQAIKQFCKWMVVNGRASESPVRHLTGLRVLQADRRHPRRALEPDEIYRLLEATKQGPERYGMTGHERYLLYRLAIESGLRRKELRSLKVSSFDFTNHIVMVTDAYSKNRKQSVLPLRKDTSVELQQFFANKLPGTKAFGGRCKQLTNKTAKMLRADLEAAGIPYVEDGFFFDFHAQRHQTGTLLAASGTHPKVAQSIMRHSDINLTMSRYTHVLTDQEAKAVENLPDLSKPSRLKTAPTGTNGQ